MRFGNLPVVMTWGLMLGALALVGCMAQPLPTPMPFSSALSLTTLPMLEAIGTAPLHPVQDPVQADKAPGVVLRDETPAFRLLDAPLKQTGRASWYGKKFDGRRTASGERFSASGLTAAHRTLPFRSYVRVRRVAGGEEVIVRITDRGPFHSGRVLDLSYAAAERIGLVALGSAMVEIELLTEHDRRLEGLP